MENCLICGGSRFSPYRSGAYGLDVSQCEGCGLVFTAAKVDAEALAARYGEDYYSFWLSPAQRKRRERLWARRTGRLEKICGRGRLLDVGCGEGLFLHTARKRGYEVSGLEFSPYAARYASENYGLEVRALRFEDCDFAPDSFDIITFWHVLEHLADPLAALRKAKELLRPGGYLVAAVPNIDDALGQAFYRAVRGEYFKVYSPDSKEPHLFHFSQETLGRLVEKAGFRLEKMDCDFAQVDPYWRIVEWFSWAFSQALKRKIYLALLAVGRK